MSNMKLPFFTYDLNSGPVSMDLLDRIPAKGNCRTAIQYYFAIFNKIKFQPDEILCPKSFRETGRLIALNFSDPNWIQLLKSGDVFFAERIRSKSGEIIDRSTGTFENEDAYITSLHTAIYIGDQNIWHATAITGATCTWRLDEFKYFYKVIAVKRFVDF